MASIVGLDFDALAVDDFVEVHCGNLVAAVLYLLASVGDIHFFFIFLKTIFISLLVFYDYP